MSHVSQVVYMAKILEMNSAAMHDALVHDEDMGHLVHDDWHKTPEGKIYFSSVLRNNRRKTFGLLERPSLSPQHTPDTLTYKVFLCGKAGVGKTATVSKLMGVNVPPVHCETPGILTSVLYWPAKIADRIHMFRFHFWDAGEQALKKFDHILPACMEKVDAVLFLFSFTDHPSFDDLANQMSRISSTDDGALKVVVGTKYDQYAHSEITSRELQDFEHQHKVPILKVKNINKARLNDSEKSPDGRVELDDVAPFLNCLAERLWYRDQIAVGLV
uniref:Ciliogenesis and planar polarity effector 2 n=1 Tax=Saccoglossus kowalevskii TaxID=10224 RepID=A0ABM0MKB4_SACKO|nr:PREDICTED: REM2- and Rab-like small GTPase 1-like isoform X3 [Saccoglossus kowalevskii]